jgi:hypothetical protein
MSPWRRLLLWALAAALVILAGLTWGSVGSAVCFYCLISMSAALLVKRFLINRDDDKFDAD